MKIRQAYYSILLFLILGIGIQFNAYTQKGFQLADGKIKDRISFDLVNNLTIIPVEVNGIKLSFLLDTGVNYTLLFSLDLIDSLQIRNVTPVKIRGLGDGEDIEALKSVHNRVKVGDALDINHRLYVIFDQRINFSPRMGVPIHGVIGYDFLKNFIVRTDYDSEMITIYDPKDYKPRSCRSCETFDIMLSKNKPYIQNKITSDGREYEITLLIDSGASDAMWLFDEKFGIRESPKNYFNDFLGLGLSGAVYGKRSKIDEVNIGNFTFNDVNVAYPDSLALRNLTLNDNRNGTLGSDILKRFTVIMDYPSRKITLKRNSFYNKPFNYNMSGIVIEHSGMVPVKSVKTRALTAVRSDRDDGAFGAVNINVNPLFTFFLTPKLVVAELRKGSPADQSGIIVGDEIHSINGKPFYDWKLAEVNELFSSKSGRKIVIVVYRNGIKVKKRFTLKKLL